jgi:arylsulfatase A-like enzyme
MRHYQNRRDFLKTLGLGAAALVVPRWLNAAEGIGKRPNIIFIMADDMGIGDTTVYNPASKIPTPNMERLAKQGIRFTDAHTPSAVCSPTRYGLVTGRYCWRTWLKKHALVGYSRPLIESSRMTVASMLKQHGYKTACIGKWHMGLTWHIKPGMEVDSEAKAELPFDDIIKMGEKVDFTRPIKDAPVDHGFDYFFGTAGCSTTDPPYVFIENNRTLGIPNVMRPDKYMCDAGHMVPDWDPTRVDTQFVQKAVEFMEGNQANPFFLYLPLSSPHAPWLPPEFVKGKSGTGLRGDMVVWVDWSVGQIMDALDRLNLEKNTLLFVTSDNGPRIGVRGHKSAGKWRGYKSHIWEGGHRVPFIVRWPGEIKANTTSDEVICLTDLMATCAAIVGTNLPDNAGEDSYNILPALLGEKLEKPIRPDVIHHSVWGVFSIRQGKWKLILDTQGSGGWVEPSDKNPVPGTPGQLYDMEKDPYEKNNLWDKRPEVVERLTRLLEKYKKQGHSRPLHGK